MRLFEKHTLNWILERGMQVVNDFVEDGSWDLFAIFVQEEDLNVPTSHRVTLDLGFTIGPEAQSQQMSFKTYTKYI